MTFWTNPKSDPKRAFKFKVTLGTGDLNSNISWMATQADKPRFTVGNTQHRYLNHTFNYPGRVEWEAVNITLVDPASPDAAGETMKMLSAKSDGCVMRWISKRYNFLMIIFSSARRASRSFVGC